MKKCLDKNALIDLLYFNACRNKTEIIDMTKMNINKKLRKYDHSYCSYLHRHLN